MSKEFYKSFIITKTNHIIIDCKVNTILGKFILDTGASNSCINILVAEKYMIKYINSTEMASTATTSIEKTYYSKKNNFQIGKLSYNNFKVFLFDMSHINKSLIENKISVVDGIIGSDILKEFNAKIDYEKRLLSLKL